jgi:pimeloyl-ACP methyl ester carboxylesterase
MDGTGHLFEPFIAALGGEFNVKVVRYPAAEPLGYAELEGIARAALPLEGPCVLLGESFSGPIAISLAASAPERLQGAHLVLHLREQPAPCLCRLESVGGFSAHHMGAGSTAQPFPPWHVLHGQAPGHAAESTRGSATRRLQNQAQGRAFDRRFIPMVGGFGAHALLARIRRPSGAAIRVRADCSARTKHAHHPNPWAALLVASGTCRRGTSCAGVRS